MENIVVKDVMKAFVRNLDTDKMYFIGATSASNVSQTVDQEFIRGDWNAPVVAVIQSGKNISFSVTPVLNSDNAIAIQSGKDFATSTVLFPREEVLKVSAGAVTLTGTPEGDVYVFTQDGEELEATVLASEVTITSATDGDIVSVRYYETVEAEVLDLAVDGYPKNCEVNLFTIAYDKDKNVIKSDICWQFSNCIPDGNIDKAYEMGNSNQSITFTCMDNGQGSYGKYIVAKRTA